MSSANDHLPPPPKTRMSPLEFRNTDLVSRLLAATPPYLYNMSLLPNTYFFSEMLRSFVQAKAERNTQTVHPPMRRSRKRNWATTRMENVDKTSSELKAETKNDPIADWMIKSNKKMDENPLELTINKPAEASELFSGKSDNFSPKLEPNQSISDQTLPPNMHNNYLQENNPQNLVLPPPPPMWYPPLYPAPPYGIDPLHFFIDLRVSGHIYDKKYQKENSASSPENFPPTGNKEKLPHTEVSDVKHEEDTSYSNFKQTKHCSAFTVPVPLNSKKSNNEKEGKSTKFDVKSMGFDKGTNKISINYVMTNISNIYKNISYLKDKFEENTSEDDLKQNNDDNEKRMKDLRAMIGLELVVDYMKPKEKEEDYSSSTDVESVGSPALEVVALNEEK